jgi:hypothetical protein
MGYLGPAAISTAPIAAPPIATGVNAPTGNLDRIAGS